MARHRSHSLGVLATGFVLVGAALLGAAPPAAAAENGTISGVVYESNGDVAGGSHLIELYRVEANGSETRLAARVMEPRGHFSFGLPPGTYRVCSSTEQVSYVVCWGADPDDPFTGRDIVLAAGENIEITLTFPPFEPLNWKTRPYIAGTPKVGWKLTAHPGRWNLRSVEFTYRWLANGVAIPGATEKTFTPSAAQQGRWLEVEVVGSSRSHSPVTVRSRQVGPVAFGTNYPSPKPYLAGTAKVGWTMTANPGTWSGPNTTNSYTWLADGAAIPGATNRTFTVTSSQVGKAIAVKVTAKAPGYATATYTTAAKPPVP